MTVELDGPMFDQEPGQVFLENVRKMMEDIADGGSDVVRQGLMSGSTDRALVRELGDRVSDHVIGRTESRSGTNWDAAAVIQVYNQGLNAAESRSLMAAASYLEGSTGTIRELTDRLNSAPAPDLTEGLE